MLTFTVHEPPNPSADRLDRAAGLVFVKDGFSWLAALFTPFWLLANRLWWPFLAYVVLSGFFELVRWAVALDAGWITMAVIGVHLLIGLEADTLRRWGLERRGWRTLGSVTGRNAAECERRFFDAWLPEQPVIAPAAGVGATGRPAAVSGRTPVIGSLQGIRS